MAHNLDLLGDPIPANWGKKGRPAHIATVKNRIKVRLLLARGWANVKIAQALRITTPTLREHYFAELRFRDEARPALEAELLMALSHAALVEHNVGAMKELGRQLEHDDIGIPAKRPVRESRPAALGKKAEADLAAQSAEEGTGWKSLLPPLVH